MELGQGGRGWGAERRRREEEYPCLGPYTQRPNSVGAWGKVGSNFVKSSPGDSKMQPCLTPACFSLRVTWPPPECCKQRGGKGLDLLYLKDHWAEAGRALWKVPAITLMRESENLVLGGVGVGRGRNSRNI